MDNDQLQVALYELWRKFRDAELEYELAVKKLEPVVRRMELARQNLHHRLARLKLGRTPPAGTKIRRVYDALNGHPQNLDEICCASGLELLSRREITVSLHNMVRDGYLDYAGRKFVRRLV